MGKKIKTTKESRSLPPNKTMAVTGDRVVDRQSFLEAPSVDFGIRLLETYVPGNYRLIAYCREIQNLKYITENLNAILNGNN